MKKDSLFKNPYIIFFPFLIFYVSLVFMFPTTGIEGDEGRYLTYAKHLMGNKASLDDFNILGNGPGYPLFLIPIIALGLPLISITLLNSLLFYLSVVLLFKSIERITSYKYAIIFSLFFACYYNAYETILLILPETLITFLIAALTYCIIKVFDEDRNFRYNIYSFLAAVLIAGIALIKPIFGYVLLTSLTGTGILWLVKNNSHKFKQSFFILLTSFLLCVPYLSYTFQKTNKLFYWSSLGGNNLYWMSSPYEGEYGSWHPDPRSITKKTFHGNEIPGYADSIVKHHSQAFNYVEQFEGPAQDDAFKRVALKNIRTYPSKFLQNCFSNLGRIFFNFPYSYKLQKPETLLRIPPNAILLVLLLLTLVPALINWKKNLFSLRFLFLYVAVYLGGSIFGSAEIRMFSIIVPVLLVWLAFQFSKTIKIKLFW